MKNVYLGDGLYVGFDGYQIRLYASDGVRVTNEVFMEPPVIAAFLKYLDTLTGVIAAANTK